MASSDPQEELKKLKKELKILRSIARHTICKKGCGLVEIVKYNNDLTCGTCGEELEPDMSAEHIKYLKEKLKNAKEEYDE